jgi:hypothetical protein
VAMAAAAAAATVVATATPPALLDLLPGGKLITRGSCGL